MVEGGERGRGAKRGLGEGGAGYLPRHDYSQRFCKSFRCNRQ